MKRSIILIATLCVAILTSAQTYTIVSRSNDTIKLYPNKLGDAIKSIVPGKAIEDGNYRLIEKVEGDKKSLLFVEFSQVLEKIFVTYETDLKQANQWRVKAYGFTDIYSSVKRVNAILLKGQLLGMNIEIYQRPDNFKDIINIDGIEIQSPIKVAVLETKINQELQNEKQEIAKLGLTEDDISFVKGKENECYIAYLVLSTHFNHSEDKTLIKELCDAETTRVLQAKYNAQQLHYLSKGRDARLDRYYK